MFTNRKPDALDLLSKRMLDQGNKEIQARKLVNEDLGINDKSQLPRENLKDWNERYQEKLKSLTEGVESKPENLQELSKYTLDSYAVKSIRNAINNYGVDEKKYNKRVAGVQLAKKKLALKEERPDDKLVPEEYKKEADKTWSEKLADLKDVRRHLKHRAPSIDRETFAHIEKKRRKGLSLALKKDDLQEDRYQKIIEALEKNAGIEASKVNKELKVGSTWVNGKGQSDTKKAETNSDIPAKMEKMPETGSKQISPAVMESVINEILANKPDMMYSDTIMETAFGDAFKAARQAGKTEFSFGGKSYNTRQKGETDAQWRANMSKNNVAPTPQPRPVTPAVAKPDNVAIKPETNPASVAAKNNLGMEGPGQAVSGPATPGVPSKLGPQRQPGMTGRISGPSTITKPETNPASVAAKRTVGMEGPGQAVSGPSTPNVAPKPNFAQVAQKAVSQTPVNPTAQAAQNARLGAAEKGLAAPAPTSIADSPINSRNIRQDVSNSANPSQNFDQAASLQSALNQKAALQAAVQAKAKSMAPVQEQKGPETSLIENILNKPKIDMSNIMESMAGGLNAL